MSEIALLLVSHGTFAKAAIQSAELIVGKQNNYETMGVELVDNIEGLSQELKEKIDSLDTSNGLLILCDLLGGTPMNLSLGHMEENVVVASGLSLPILIEVLMNGRSDIKETSNVIENAHNNALHIKNFNDLKGDEDDDSL